MISYLGRQRTAEDVDSQPIAQLVNVTTLDSCQRCFYCWYYKQGRTLSEYYDCSDKNRCGGQSLLFALMNNIRERRSIPDDLFTPTPLIRQRTINLDKRYLQFFSADNVDYECNSLCQYYPERIASDKSIAECSNTNGCGRDGSFFDLLTLADTQLPSLPDFANTEIPAGSVMLLDGTIRPLADFEQPFISDDGHVMLTGTDGSDYFIMSMDRNRPTAWYVLAAMLSDPRTWLFFHRADPSYFLPSQTLVFTDSTNSLYTLLTQQGITGYAFEQVYNARAEYSDADLGDLIFVYSTYLIASTLRNTHNVVGIRPLNSNDFFAFSLGMNSAGTAHYLLVSDPFYMTPSSWKKALISDNLPSNWHIIDVSDRTSEMARWLMFIGVRTSYFY